MQHKNNLLMLCTFLLLFVIQASQAQKPLLCYVCEDCAKITADTPVEECNADFFIPGGTTLPSTMTTTPNDPTTDSSTTASTSSTTESTTMSTPSTTMSTTESTTASTTESTTDSTTASTSTTMSTTDATSSTTEMSTTEDTTTESTEAPSTPSTMPTPPTLVPSVPTTSMPTPPNVGTTPSSNDGIDKIVLTDGVITDLSHTNASTALVNATVPFAFSTTTAALHLRQLRAVVTNGYTYHCYSVLKEQNGKTATQRGCSRVLTEQAVCSELEKLNTDSTLSKCNPCSMPKCNSAGALHASFLTLCIVALAAFLRYN